jgi:hypothetical protein
VLPPLARRRSEDHLAHLVGASASDIRVTLRDFAFPCRSPLHWIEVFRSWYGPFHKTFGNLPAEEQFQLEQDHFDLIARFNCSENQTIVVPSEYLEVVVIKK